MYLRGTSFGSCFSAWRYSRCFILPWKTEQLAYENLLQLLSLCNTYPVVPSKSRKQGRVRLIRMLCGSGRRIPLTWSDNFNYLGALGFRSGACSKMVVIRPMDPRGSFTLQQCLEAGGYVQSGYVTTDSYNLLGGQRRRKIITNPKEGLTKINLQIFSDQR